MTIKWINQTCVAKGHPYADGVLENGMVAFTLLKPPRSNYWKLKVLTFFNCSLYFTSVETAKKEAHEIVNGRSKLKLY